MSSLPSTKCLEGAVFCPEQVTGRPHLHHGPWAHQEHHRSFQRRSLLTWNQEADPGLMKLSWPTLLFWQNSMLESAHRPSACLPSFPDRLSHVLLPPFPSTVGMEQTFGQRSLGRSNMAHLNLVLKHLQAILPSLSALPKSSSWLHL